MCGASDDRSADEFTRNDNGGAVRRLIDDRMQTEALNRLIDVVLLLRKLKETSVGTWTSAVDVHHHARVLHEYDPIVRLTVRSFEIHGLVRGAWAHVSAENDRRTGRWRTTTMQT